MSICVISIFKFKLYMCQEKVQRIYIFHFDLHKLSSQLTMSAVSPLRTNDDEVSHCPENNRIYFDSFVQNKRPIDDKDTTQTKDQIIQGYQTQVAEKDKQIQKLNVLVSKLMADIDQLGKCVDA